MLTAVKNADWNSTTPVSNLGRTPAINRPSLTLDPAAFATKGLSRLRTDKAGTRAFDVMRGSGAYIFPSGLPETYYAQLLSAVSQRAAAQRAPLLSSLPGEPFAPRVLLHGGVHLRRVARNGRFKTPHSV